MGKSSSDSDKKKDKKEKKAEIGAMQAEPAHDKKDKEKKKSHGKKHSDDEGVKAAKAGLCACGICCALCIGIPCLIIIIIIIIIVVAVGSAEDDIKKAFRNCDVIESGSCFADWDCRGDRKCDSNSCTGNADC